MSLPRWRENDKRRRQAIHAFIGDRRDELLKCIPKKYLGDANAKRNELVRLGRQRFSEQPRRVQERYLQSVTASTAKAGEEFVTPPQKKSVKRKLRLPKQDRAAHRRRLPGGLPGKSGANTRKANASSAPGPPSKSGGNTRSANASSVPRPRGMECRVGLGLCGMECRIGRRSSSSCWSISRLYRPFSRGRWHLM